MTTAYMLELAQKQRGTVDYINAAPSVITLTPTVRTLTDAGGYEYTDGTAREPQTLRVIPMTFDQRPTITQGGTERIIDCTLLGPVDAVMDIDDYWTGDDGSRFQIVAFTDGHGYEIKALVERHLPRD